MPTMWAGKDLTTDEELRLRRTVALLRRIEESDPDENVTEDRYNLERFLPENDHKWTPDELEFGAHVGPWFRAEDSTVN